ncbi:choice-of-anchor R domain-containing protein [uncultured Thiohalocapsa sp.]|uniref:choice-of-anchor R domain-containing protein n=1 Tax=uncultured Thiohalocapsa sp. TaxID=768990 RepID=UPI0025E0430E|nr:choice-of-anchor R domain-containing protein [uncultured Thiohalocapsa sp.]
MPKSLSEMLPQAAVLSRLQGAAVAVCALAAFPIQAAFQVSNLANSNAGSWAFTSATPDSYLANSFTTDGSDYVLTGATLGLGNSGTSQTTFQASIWSDAGSSPDTLLLTFDNTPTLDGGETFQDVAFFSDDGFTLAANSTYYLALHAIAGSLLSWGYTTDSSVQAPGGWGIGFSQSDTTMRSTNGGSSWSSIPASSLSAHRFGISTAVPVPNVMLPGLFGLGLTLLMRRRRRC